MEQLGYSAEQQTEANTHMQSNTTNPKPQALEEKQSTKTRDLRPIVHGAPQPHIHVFNTINSPRRNEVIKHFQAATPMD